MAVTPPVVLTIAGFDPSSGAGITADIKTIAAHECYGVACITALTVQSTRGVRRVEPVDARIISETLDELVSDFAVEAVHIGMLGNEDVVKAVADFLGKAALPHVVLDPILKSSSGKSLYRATTDAFSVLSLSFTSRPFVFKITLSPSITICEALKLLNEGTVTSW